MKLLAGLFLTFLALLPGRTFAETVGVRSGDHPGFSRLVVQLKGQEDWAFGRVDGGFEFRPGRKDVIYRLEHVFDKIGRSRIESVDDLGEGRLRLGVSCNCHAVVDELPDGQVVLDIAVGPARAPGTGADAVLLPFDVHPENGGVTSPGRLEEPEAADDPVAKPADVSDRAGLPLTLPRVGPFAIFPEKTPEPTLAKPVLSQDSDLASMEPKRDNPPEAHPETPIAVPASADDNDSTARIARTEAALLEQVARAAAQGLLDADMSGIEEDIAGTSPAPAEAPPAPTIDPPPPPVTKRGHMTVETSVDRAASGAERQGEETNEGDACIDPALFEIGSWGDEITNGTDIGAYRSKLITELDVADGPGVSALIRNYIYITFGAEAKALIRKYPDSVERPDLLFAMAEIMDDGRSTKAADLVDQMTCNGATALWATLAQPELRPAQAINRDAVSIAFSALPTHLRRHLGPKLAERLLAAGDLATADLIKAAVDRAGDTPTSDYDILTAQLELEAGEATRAAAVLDDVVAAGDAAMPDALLQRVEAILANDGAVADDVVVLLDSLAFQFRGTDTARRMVDAGIRARASTGAFDAAFEQRDAAATAGLFSPEHSKGLLEGLYEKVTRNTGDTEFLRLALPRLEEVGGLSATPRRSVARRLLELGLAGPARQISGSDSAMPDVADRQLLAQAALLENRPAVAIGYLAGLTDSAALSTRAEALEMARDHAGAMRAYEATGDREKMLRMAWRGGLWSDVAKLDPGPIGAAAQLMAEKPVRQGTEYPDGGQREGTAAATPGIAGADAPVSDVAASEPYDQPALAGAQALITESEATRQVLDALLNEVGSPSAGTVPKGAPGL